VKRIELPTVTLCAATSVNVAATMAAIRLSTDQIVFGDVLLFTDATGLELPQNGRIVPIPRLKSGRDYSRFLLERLADHVATDHCLIIQWDGFVLDADRWTDRFLECDYIGAPWPQFGDGRTVGNGGFSLRSRRLLDACRTAKFVRSHPEDVAIGRVNRDYLEQDHALVFADHELAARFSVERSPSSEATFGFHGVFNMIPLLGADCFWNLYRSLTDRSTVFHDYALLMRQLGRGRDSAKRRLRLTIDFVRSWGAGPGSPQA
jgi:hypothetical protein